MSLNYQNYQVKQGNFNSLKFTQPLEETIKQAANKVEKWPGYPKIDFYVRLPSNASNSQLHSEVVKEFWNWFMRHKDEFSGHEEWRFPDYDNGDIEITGLCAVEGPFDKNKRCEWHLDIKLQRGYLRL
ncbi:hypothetical protein PHLCEN_2v3372 [Hermanssonia centrifuga]|uniref:Uncharacterized protein n=1 Tax=Hermanssonia centrifuga TaxID=98765 RepID=A0A2R6QM29_9APHY|nr:hypothetical protein PHLCEN_2v3372 [Hermanssonia centrifuga]